VLGMGVEGYIIAAVTVFLIVIMAVIVGTLLAKSVYGYFDQRRGVRQSRDEVRSVESRLNRLGIEVDVFLHNTDKESDRSREQGREATSDPSKEEES
jgi:hypothetical protein